MIEGHPCCTKQRVGFERWIPWIQSSDHLEGRELTISTVVLAYMRVERSRLILSVRSGLLIQSFTSKSAIRSVGAKP